MKAFEVENTTPKHTPGFNSEFLELRALATLVAAATPVAFATIAASATPVALAASVALATLVTVATPVAPLKRGAS